MFDSTLRVTVTRAVEITDSGYNPSTKLEFKSYDNVVDLVRELNLDLFPNEADSFLKVVLAIPGMKEALVRAMHPETDNDTTRS